MCWFQSLFSPPPSVAAGALALHTMESAPPLSGENGGEFPVPSFTGYAQGGLPLPHEVDSLRVQPTPSSTCPIHVVLGGALPTSNSMDSDSLETWWCMGWLGYSTLDLWQHLSDVAMVCCQPSASRRRMMTK